MIRVKLLGHVLAAGYLAGCSFDTSGVEGGGMTGTIDAAAVDASMMDAGMVDSMPIPPDQRDMAARLLLTEVIGAPNPSEFIEIYNPGTQAVDLSNYYLSDHPEYAKLPGIFGAGPEPMLDTNSKRYDFVVKFPDGASIGPGEIIVVATSYTGFNTAYQTEFGAAEFALFGSTDPAIVMVDPGAAVQKPLITGEATFSGDGECVVLFYWDGVSDLVVDVDMVNFGAGLMASNKLGNKGGIVVDGPDDGMDVTRYASEPDLAETATDPTDDKSFKRIRREEGYEMQNADGNGVKGDQETSEDIRMTWDDGAEDAEPGAVDPCVEDPQGTGCM